MKTLKRHLTVANVLSCIAIFVALSATAVAATKLGNGQVKAVNIANEAVTNPKIKKLAVTNPKLGKEAVTSGKIKKLAVTNPKLGKEAVTSGKIKKQAVGSSALAPEAVTSAKISSGLYLQLLKNASFVSVETATNENEEKTTIANCPTGKQAISGGVRVNGTLKEVAVTGTQPYFNGSIRSGWEGFARDIVPGGGAGPWSLTVFAVCAEF